MEYKVLPNATKSIEGRSVIGITAVTGNIDDGQDRIWSGAFSKTIQEGRRRFRHLWMHDDNPPTAAITDIKEVGRDELPPAVLEYAPAATGGLQVTREYLDTPRGNEILTAIKAGALNEMSFGYDTVPGKFKFSDDGGVRVRELYEVKLFDTSDVLWGMNPATVGAKSLIPAPMLLKQIKAWVDNGGSLGLYLEILRQVTAGLSTVQAEAGQDAETIEDVLETLPLVRTSLWNMLDELHEAAGMPDMYGYGYMSHLPVAERKQLRGYLEGLLSGKAGARHSAADSKMINELHALTTQLGATNCRGLIDEAASTDATDEEKSRAAQALTLSSQALALFELDNYIHGVRTDA